MKLQILGDKWTILAVYAIIGPNNEQLRLPNVSALYLGENESFGSISGPNTNIFDVGGFLSMKMFVLDQFDTLVHRITKDNQVFEPFLGQNIEGVLSAQYWAQ